MANSTNRYQVQEKGMISSLQYFFLAITIVLSTADIFLPAFVAQDAGRDSWIAVITSTLTSLIVSSIFITLGLKYPEKTIIQYSCDILGKPLGKLIGLIFIFYAFNTVCAVCRELGELFVISFNPDSPILVYIIIVILVGAYAVGMGIEPIARVNEILFPIGIGILLIITLINIPKMDFNNFLPVLYNGFYPVAKGSIPLQGWLLQTVILLQLIPFTKSKEKIKKNTLAAVAILGVSLEIGVLTIAVFGDATRDLLLPALNFVRIARIGEYFTNLDISIMGVWVGGIFIKVAVFFFITTLGISQVFGFKSYKPLIIPVGTAIISFSMSISRDIVEFTYYLHYIYPLFSFSVAFFIPLLLFAVSIIKNRKRRTL